MIKKTITYVDYDGNQRTEDFYFNLNKVELMEMHVSEQGGLEATVKALIASQDNKRIMEIFKELLLKAYGTKSLDGKRFIKSDEARVAFLQSEAYTELFMELATDAEAAAAFVNGIVPVIKAPEVGHKADH